MNWNEQYMTLGTEFWAAIIGALTGGFISFCIQIFTLLAAKKERLAITHERNESLARSAIFKVMRICSNLNFLHTYMEDCYQNSDPKQHDEPFTFVSPLVTLPENVNFSTDELALVLSLKHESLIENLMSLDSIHNDTCKIFKTYNDLRSDFQHTTPADMDGNVAASYFSQDEMRSARPRMVVMNNLIIAMRERAKQDFNFAEKVANDLVAAINKNLGLSIELTVKNEILSKVAGRTSTES